MSLVALTLIPGAGNLCEGVLWWEVGKQRSPHGWPSQQDKDNGENRSLAPHLHSEGAALMPQVWVDSDGKVSYKGARVACL